VTGAALALSRRAQRGAAVWLLVILPSYYFALLNVVLYVYDRFVLPIGVVLALFGGVALDSLLSWTRPGNEAPARPAVGSTPATLSPGKWSPALHGLAVGGIVLLFAYSALYSGLVDVLMLGDSRYTVQRWMAVHVTAGETVGVTGLHEYLPDVAAYREEDIDTAEDLRRLQPRYFILNADYAAAAPPGSEQQRLTETLRDGAHGYRLAFRYRRPTPWAWLPWAHPDLVGDRHERVALGILRNLNPTIEVYANGGS
jgi:hypothetical protein